MKPPSSYVRLNTLDIAEIFCCVCPHSAEALEDGGGDEGSAGHRYASPASGTQPTPSKPLGSPFPPRLVFPLGLFPFPTHSRQSLNLRLRGIPSVVHIFLFWECMLFAISTSPVISIASLPKRREVNVTGGFDWKGGRVGFRTTTTWMCLDLQGGKKITPAPVFLGFYI